MRQAEVIGFPNDSIMQSLSSVKSTLFFQCTRLCNTEKNTVLQKWHRLPYYYQIIQGIHLFRLNDLSTSLDESSDF